MKKLLFIDTEQYGYHTDVYKFCQHLKNYETTVICYDTGLNRIISDKIKVVYVKAGKNKKINLLFFLIRCLLYIFSTYDFCFICFFPHCELLKIISRKKLHLDIRSMCVSQSEYWRKDFDSKLKNSIKYFDSISAISNGIARKLSLNDYYPLPLGADIISSTNKDFSTLHLLYIGVLSNRHIYETVSGINMFLMRHKDVKLVYDIVGYGSEESVINEMIKNYNLDEIITMHGRKPYHELKHYLDVANIGISYIPMADYYDYQPPTKTFEYVLSGLYCIATATSANKDVISKENGILIQDNSESFAEALEYILFNKDSFRSEKIVSSLKNYQWEKIVTNYLIPIIENESKNQ